jgi:Kef-type K+ transport system membrane component KefB
VDLFTLALIIGVGTAGALLAIPERLRAPVVIGELAAGVVLGRTGAHVVHVGSPVIKSLATVGFATVMLTAGSHVPVGDKRLRPAAKRAGMLVAVTALCSVAGAFVISHAAGTRHVALYAVLLASTSAALVLPLLVDTERVDLPHDDPRSTPTLVLMAQAALADTACIVALPLVADPHRAVRAALGGVAVALGAVVVFTLGHVLYRGNRGLRLHELSVKRSLALELRLSLVFLLVLAGAAVHLGTSVMLAGFACGLVLSALGEPRRLASQLFAVADGFLSPIFFVWLGATLDLRALGDHPKFLIVGLGLGFGAIVVHVIAGVVLRQPVNDAVIAASQLGVPVAAVTIGEAAGAVSPGEAGAIILGALITVLAATVMSRWTPNPRVRTR